MNTNTPRPGHRIVFDPSQSHPLGHNIQPDTLIEILPEGPYGDAGPYALTENGFTVPLDACFRIPHEHEIIVPKDKS